MRSWAAIVTFALMLGSPCGAVAEDYGIGPWYVLVEQDRAVAVLNDLDEAWTLLVRCTDGHIDFVVRRVDAGVTPVIRHEQVTLQIDGKPVAQLPAQTWSAGGHLMLDVGSLLPSLEAGLRIEFTFSHGQERTQVSFLAGHTAVALKPVRDRCPAGVS